MNSAALIVFLANSLLYFFVGHSLGQKSFKHQDDQRAWRAFRVWWYGMSANTALNGISVLLLGLGVEHLALFVLLSVAATLSAAPALWGLLTYLMYIFKGSHRASRWIAGFYIAFGLFLLVSIYLLKPIEVTLGDWEAIIQYQNTPQGLLCSVFGIVLVLLLSLPPVLASFGMFSLHFKVTERSAKFRALLVPIGFFFLFGVGYFIPLLLILVGINVNATTWWPPSIRILGILALVLIYLAYFPPLFIQRWLKVKTVLE